MVRLILSLVIMVIAFLFSAGAIAHPGHGTLPAESPIHFLEPMHALWLVGVVLLLQLGWKWRTSRC